MHISTIFGGKHAFWVKELNQDHGTKQIPIFQRQDRTIHFPIEQQHVSLSGYKPRFNSSEVSKKMDAVNESDSSLVNKCLDLCHALAGQGKAFKFSLTIGSTFTFSLESREGKETPPTRKKKSPSTLRRNAKRREDVPFSPLPRR